MIGNFILLGAFLLLLVYVVYSINKQEKATINDLRRRLLCLSHNISKIDLIHARFELKLDDLETDDDIKKCNKILTSVYNRIYYLDRMDEKLYDYKDFLTEEEMDYLNINKY